MARIKTRFQHRPRQKGFTPSPAAVVYDKPTVFCVEVRPRCKFSSTLMRFTVGGQSDEEIEFKAIRECCDQFKGQALGNPAEWSVVSMLEIKQMTLF